MPRMPGHCVVFSSLLLAGCFSPVTEGGVIGPGGGTVQGAGVTLVVPPGALAEITALRVEALAAAAPPGFTALGSAVRLSPEGTHFDQPVRLELTLLAGAPEVQVATTPSLGNAWELLAAEVIGQRAVVDVRHFSVFIPVTPADAGVRDAGATDAGAVDAGPPAPDPERLDAGREPEDAGSIAPLERCQALDGGQPLVWSVIPTPDDEVPYNLAKILVIERPGHGYVFAVGTYVVSVDRDLRVIESREVTIDRGGGFTGMNGAAVGLEAVLNSSMMAIPCCQFTDYAEWRVGLDGHFERRDGGFITRIEAGSSYVGQGVSEGTGSGYAPRRGGFLVGTVGWGNRAVSFVPAQTARPVQWAPMPPGWTGSAGGVELADGRAFFVLLDTGANRIRVFELGADGGLQATPAVFANPELQAPILAAGGPDGFVLIRPEPDAMTFIRPDGGTTRVSLPTTVGTRYPLYDPVRTLPDGGVLALALMMPPTGHVTAPIDVFAVRYPPGEAVPILTGLIAGHVPGFGAIRDDSMVIARTDGPWLEVARVCLPK